MREGLLGEPIAPQRTHVARDRRLDAFHEARSIWSRFQKFDRHPIIQNEATRPRVTASSARNEDLLSLGRGTSGRYPRGYPCQSTTMRLPTQTLKARDEVLTEPDGLGNVPIGWKLRK
jgi:hypothetical protein